MNQKAADGRHLAPSMTREVGSVTRFPSLSFQLNATTFTYMCFYVLQYKYNGILQKKIEFLYLGHSRSSVGPGKISLRVSPFQYDMTVQRKPSQNKFWVSHDGK